MGKLTVIESKSKKSDNSVIEKKKKKKDKGDKHKKEESAKVSGNADIDDLFDDLAEDKKKKKRKEEKAEKKKEKEEKEKIELEKRLEIEQKVSNRDANGRIISPYAPVERVDTATGLPVYKAHLLEVGGGGGTDQCPFDCDCCF